MAGHKVEQDLYSPCVSLVKKLDQILICAVARSDALVVANVVTRVHKRRIIHGIEPDSVAAEVFYVIELLDYSLQIADTVAV